MRTFCLLIFGTDWEGAEDGAWLRKKKKKKQVLYES